jgi:hypothetical protein
MGEVPSEGPVSLGSAAAPPSQLAPSPDEWAALKGWLRDSGAPAPHRPHSSVEMATARAEIEAERVDDLAKAERWIQQCVRAVPLSYPQLLIDELARLRLVEQAATALVEHWEAIRNPADKLVWTIAEQLTERLAAAVHGETP